MAFNLYTDARRNSCEETVAHYGDHWQNSGLEADQVWCPASARASSRVAANVAAPPLLLVATTRGSTLQLRERPGAEVARFELSSCPGRDRYAVAPDHRRLGLSSNTSILLRLGVVISPLNLLYIFYCFLFSYFYCFGTTTKYPIASLFTPPQLSQVNKYFPDGTNKKKE